jgi:hypothetical protein
MIGKEWFKITKDHGNKDHVITIIGIKGSCKGYRTAVEVVDRSP